MFAFDGDIDIRRQITSIELGSEILMPVDNLMMSALVALQQDEHVESVFVDVKLMAVGTFYQ